MADCDGLLGQRFHTERGNGQAEHIQDVLGDVSVGGDHPRVIVDLDRRAVKWCRLRVGCGIGFNTYHHG